MEKSLKKRKLKEPKIGDFVLFKKSAKDRYNTEAIIINMNKEKTSITMETKSGKEYTRHRTDVLIPIVLSKPADELSKPADLKPVIREKPSVPADKKLTDMPAKNGNLRRSPRFPAAKITNRKTYLFRSANGNDNNENDDD